MEARPRPRISLRTNFVALVFGLESMSFALASGVMSLAMASRVLALVLALEF
jgi:hypothetical protein